MTMRLSVKQILAALIAAAAATCAAAPTQEPSWRDLLYSFENVNSTDFFHLGDDGVLRHLNESGAVLNYAPLSPQQISQSLADSTSSSLDTAEKKEHLSRVFENVDGRDVQGSALLNPPANIYPSSFLSNRKPSSGTSAFARSDLGLNLRQQCVHRRCFPGENCRRYPGCSRCFVADMSREGSCQ